MEWIEEFVETSHRAIDDRVREALWSRGVDDRQIDLFRIGYVGNEPLWVGQERFDRWARGFEERLRDVFVLPLTNALGQVKGLQFRAVEVERRGYVDYFQDDFEPVLFGLAQAIEAAWKSRSIWLVEGAFDLFPVQRLRPNTASVLTAQASPGLVRLLRRIVDRVYLGYDRDESGRRGASDFIREHGRTFEVRTLTYPDGLLRADGQPVKDPNNLWEACGDEGLLELLRCMEGQEPHQEPLHAADPLGRRRHR